MDIVAIIQPWLFSIVILVIFFIARIVFRTIIIDLLLKITSQTESTLDDDIVDAINHPTQFLLLVLGIFFSLQVSPLTSVADHIFTHRLLNSSIVITIFWMLINLATNNKNLLSQLLDMVGLHLDETICNIVSPFLRFCLVALASTMVITEWGYDITGLVAGLSIGGLAISLAAKDALANVFGSIVILLDKPFVVGDWINVNGIEGSVEKISFRSTRLRTFPQALVYVPNSILSNSSILNYTKREKRRIEFTLRLSYSTTSEQMSDFIASVRAFLISHPHIYQEDLTVTFHAYGTSSLDVYVICYTSIIPYVDFLALKEEINLKIMEIVQETEVEMAFPSTSIYFETPLELRQK